MADSTDSSDGKYRQYNPYKDLNFHIQNLYNLPTSPEYLFPEESAFQRRSVGSNVQYYAGPGYVSGAIFGAAKGSVEGLKAAERGETMKIRINRVLNSGGQTGRRFGNSLGAVGLIYGGLEGWITHKRDTDDTLNSVLAGLGTGALYKAASGPRSAVVAGALGGLAVGISVAGKHVLKRYVPI
ncbi:Mitochondrial inner membrane translocase subunit Tim17/Tim22/Tim23/peroxisomal protein PMP24 [Macleaya cordata]|uniref:Mitochondrial inner membrane translocase subunit Tim17/Tim22/Tim23/peroxisomal protein PMP24 n=1 Tax=Macleaya cordata TaxID=56857 RepID=A0A200R3H7_MACCD|nr:Mitochondrial inner membrane translocase subunit Tim17/Tim22/Tim23/peroxisomal protein PMP24 [Macleaya cordata]